MRARLFILCVGMLAETGVCGDTAVNIPVIVHEAVAGNLKGVDRRSEPVRLGLPFTDEMAVKEQNGRPLLKVEGSSVYQARTLARWPDGNVRWALLDFMSDCGPGAAVTNARVLPGTGASEGKMLALESDASITVDTGAMNVVVNRRGFNLFDSVSVGGVDVVVPGSPGVVLVGKDGTAYSGAADAGGDVRVEENGPARCVILAKGTHRNGNKRMMDYTVRMHFYKGKTGVRIFYTLRNASSDQQELVEIKGVELAVKVKVGPKAGFKIAKHDGVTAGELAGTNSVLYLQRMSSFPNVGKWKWTEGYEIVNGAEKLVSSPGAKQFPDVAWLDLSSGAGAGVLASMRYAAGYWPAALRASADGCVAVCPWPVEAGIMHQIPFPTHNTREVWFEFHAVPLTDPAAAAFRFQYPLVAKGPVDWYNRCQDDLDIYPLYHFVSRAEEAEFAAKQGWNNRWASRGSRLTLWSYWYWGLGGFQNQHDFARTDLVDFLRDTTLPRRAGESFLAAEARLNYNADYSTPHSDGPKQVNRQFGLQKKTTFEWEHRHWYGMPLYYYLTGDERLGEVSRGYAELMTRGTVGMDQCVNLTYNFERVISWGLYTLGAGWNLSDFKNERFVELLRANAGKLLTGRERFVVDWERGGMYAAPAPGATGIVHECKPFLMMGYIMHDGFWSAARNLPEGDPLRERLEDAIEGVEWVMARECFYFPGEKTAKGKEGKDLWCPYHPNLDDPNSIEPDYFLPGECGNAVALPVERFGEEFRKDLSLQYVRSCYQTGHGWGGYTFICHPGAQATLWRVIHPKKDQTPPAPVGNLKAEALGSGQVKISWTVPAGDAVKYQIKYSGKKIVPNLNFDRVKRTWEFDPKEYSAWWASENVQGEPRPGAAGSEQSFIAKDIPAGKCVFAIRSWDQALNRSAVSNMAECDVK